jgi:hypothetical protein
MRAKKAKIRRTVAEKMLNAARCMYKLHPARKEFILDQLMAQWERVNHGTENTI